MTPQPAPSWMDRPNAPGLWVVRESRPSRDTMRRLCLIREGDAMHYHGGPDEQWHGPIPEPPQ